MRKIDKFSLVFMSKNKNLIYKIEIKTNYSVFHML